MRRRRYEIAVLIWFEDLDSSSGRFKHGFGFGCIILRNSIDQIYWP
jgi:hypothetical protein